MKNKLILTLSILAFSATTVFAQGDWSVGDQSYSPAMQPQSQGIPSTEKLTVEGTYTWMSFKSYDQNQHGMTLTYELPVSLIASTGTPSLMYMDRTPVVGATFTPTSYGYIANFAPNTILPPTTKLIFRIADLEIKDDQAYSNQVIKHSADFTTPSSMENTANNQATISFNSFVAAGPLPIQLLDFTAIMVDEKDNQLVKLDWSTSSEKNSSHFIVERSKNATDWEDVARVKAAGNSSTKIAYASIDTDPLYGTSYYRLKQFDMDGTFDYSKVRTVSWILEGADNVRLHPNPTTDFVNVAIELQSKSLIEIKVTGIDGRVIQSTTAWVEKGGDDLKMDFSQLANGIYNLTVYKNNEKYFTSKVQKQ